MRRAAQPSTPVGRRRRRLSLPDAVAATTPVPADLEPIDQRILGSLIEKQRTVPASYPLSLNGLRTACNQTTSRDPVVHYDEQTLTARLRGLRDRGLIRTVWTGTGARVAKYHQLLEEALGVEEAELAVLTVLLLRGPQSAGELRNRTERLHPFADRHQVQAVLQALADREVPLVAELPQRPGHQDVRWVHRLGPVPGAEPATAPAAPAVDRELVLAHGTDARDARVMAGYDAVAASYAAQIADEFDHKPFDRWLLGRIPELAAGAPIADVGCGPGHGTALMAACGADVVGIDVSAGMVDVARHRYPDLRFQQGDLTRLLRPLSARAWGSVTAWYSLVHLAASELPAAVAAIARVIRPGGWFAFSLHTGAEVRHVTDWWGHPVDLDFVFHDPAYVREAVADADLTVVEWYLRGPLADAELDTESLYLLAQTPH